MQYRTAATLTAVVVLLSSHPLRAGETEEAAAIEEQAARLRAWNEPVREIPPPSNETDLAKANAEIDRLKSVIDDLRVRLERERRNSHYNMGYVYKVCRQYGRAEREFLKALEIDPEDPWIHYNLGILYQDDLKNRAKAREHYGKFLELAPYDPDAPRVREWMSAL